MASTKCLWRFSSADWRPALAYESSLGARKALVRAEIRGAIQTAALSTGGKAGNGSGI